MRQREVKYLPKGIQLVCQRAEFQHLYKYGVRAPNLPARMHQIYRSFFAQRLGISDPPLTGAQVTSRDSGIIEQCL